MRRNLEIFSFTILLVASLLTIPSAVGKPSDNPSFAGGSGTENDPYQIANLEQLQAMEENLTAHYALVDNIDASETENWNLDDIFKGEVLGGSPQTEFQTHHSPVVEDSERIYVNMGDGFEVDEGDYEMDYATGKIVFEKSLDNLYENLENLPRVVNVFIDYETVEEHPRGFDPIGEENNEFVGDFHGQGYEIRNLFIDRPDEDSVGLFGRTGSDSFMRENDIIRRIALIENVSLINVDVTGNRSVGGLVGRHGGLVADCYVNGDVTGNRYAGGLIGICSGRVSDSHAVCGVDGRRGVGGLVGYLLGGKVADCYANGDVTGRASVGGLVGRNWGKVWGVINSYSTADVTGDFSVGGLVGSNRGGVSGSYAISEVDGVIGVGGLVGRNSQEVANCYTASDVAGQISVGGLVGGNSGEVTNSYSIADVTEENAIRTLESEDIIESIENYLKTGLLEENSVGGLVGMNRGFYGARRGKVSGLYWNVETSGRDEGIGNAEDENVYGRTTGKMTYPYARNTYENWDFDNTWEIDEDGDVNAGYPFLRDLPVRDPGVEPPEEGDDSLPWLWIGIGAAGGIAILVFLSRFLSRGSSGSSSE